MKETVCKEVPKVKNHTEPEKKVSPKIEGGGGKNGYKFIGFII